MIEVIYDFLHHLIFGSDLPYLQKALDPLTLSLILGGAKALTDAGQGIAANARAKKQRVEGGDCRTGSSKTSGLDFETGPKLGVTQDTRVAELDAPKRWGYAELARSKSGAVSAGYSFWRYGPHKR